MAEMFPPKKNTAFTLVLTIRDADGDLVTGATALDSEISIDGAAFADCTNEAVEIGTSGIYTLALTSGEMNGDVITVQTKTTSSGAKTAVNVIYTAVRTVSELATQTSVDDLPTNAELATALGTADDAVLAAIAALNNLSQANIRTAVGLATGNLDTQLDAIPTNAELATALAAADDAVLAAIAALNNLSSAGAQAAAEAALAAYDAATGGDVAALTIPTAAENADAVWDEAIAGHLGAGSTGEALTNAGGSGTPPTVAEIADEVETRDLHLTAAYDAAKTAATQTSVDDLPTNAELATALGTADDAVLAAIAALNDLSQAEVAVAVWDEIIEAAETAREQMRLNRAASAGKLSGAATNTIRIRNAADSLDRMVATVDPDGNRSAVAVNVS